MKKASPRFFFGCAVAGIAMRFAGDSRQEAVRSLTLVARMMAPPGSSPVWHIKDPGGAGVGLDEIRDGGEYRLVLGDGPGGAAAEPPSGCGWAVALDDRGSRLSGRERHAPVLEREVAEAIRRNAKRGRRA